MAQPPLVIHCLDRFQNDLGATLQVRHSSVDFLRLDDDEPVDKVRVNCPDRSILLEHALKFLNAPVGETTTANPDPLEHAVASQLVHHQGRVQEQGGLVVVWHDATDEVGIGGVEGGQELVKLGPEGGGHGLEDLGPGVLALLLLLDNLEMRCGRMCKIFFLDEFATTLAND